MCEEVERDNVMSRGGQQEIRLTARARRKREERTGKERGRRDRFCTSDSASGCLADRTENVPFSLRSCL